MEQSVLVEDTLEIATEIPKMSLGPGTVILCDIFCIKFRRCQIVKARVYRGQKYFNIALVLQDDLLTILTRPANTCTCPLKVYPIKTY